MIYRINLNYKLISNGAISQATPVRPPRANDWIKLHKVGGNSTGNRSSYISDNSAFSAGGYSQSSYAIKDTVNVDTVKKIQDLLTENVGEKDEATNCLMLTHIPHALEFADTSNAHNRMPIGLLNLAGILDTVDRSRPDQYSTGNPEKCETPLFNKVYAQWKQDNSAVAEAKSKTQQAPQYIECNVNEIVQAVTGLIQSDNWTTYKDDVVFCNKLHEIGNLLNNKLFLRLFYPKFMRLLKDEVGFSLRNRTITQCENPEMSTDEGAAIAALGIFVPDIEISENTTDSIFHKFVPDRESFVNYESASQALCDHSEAPLQEIEEFIQILGGHKLPDSVSWKPLVQENRYLKNILAREIENEDVELHERLRGKTSKRRKKGVQETPKKLTRKEILELLGRDKTTEKTISAVIKKLLDRTSIANTELHSAIHFALLCSPQLKQADNLEFKLFLKFLGEFWLAEGLNPQVQSESLRESTSSATPVPSRSISPLLSSDSSTRESLMGAGGPFSGVRSLSSLAHLVSPPTKSVRGEFTYGTFKKILDLTAFKALAEEGTKTAVGESLTSSHLGIDPESDGVADCINLAIAVIIDEASGLNNTPEGVTFLTQRMLTYMCTPGPNEEQISRQAARDLIAIHHSHSTTEDPIHSDKEAIIKCCKACNEYTDEVEALVKDLEDEPTIDTNIKFMTALKPLAPKTYKLFVVCTQTFRNYVSNVIMQKSMSQQKLLQPVDEEYTLEIRGEQDGFVVKANSRFRGMDFNEDGTVSIQEDSDLKVGAYGLETTVTVVEASGTHPQVTCEFKPDIEDTKENAGVKKIFTSLFGSRRIKRSLRDRFSSFRRSKNEQSTEGGGAAAK